MEKYNKIKDNLDIIIAEVEWQYPIDYANTFDEIKNIINNYEKMERSLDKASELISEHTGSCPFDLLDKKLDCNNCTNNYKGCWKEYLLDV